MKIKKKIYVFFYLLFFVIISLLNMFSVTDVLDNRLNLKLVSNPLLFTLVDGIFIYLMMRKLKKEPYKLQQEVLDKFKGTANLVVFIILLLSCSFIVILVVMIINYLLIVYLRPLSRNEDEKNALEDYFKDHPEKKYSKFYNSKEEILEDYKSVKKEVETEIPVLDVKIKEKRKKKTKKLISNLIPIFVIVILFIGTSFALVEGLKKFSRARYNYFEITINNEEIDIVYDEEYRKVIIPYVYTQYESHRFYSDQTNTHDNYMEKKDKYILEIKEYICHNDKKDRVSCGQENIVEKQKEIESKNNKLIIKLKEKVIYEGKFINDISKYLTDIGNYDIEIINTKKDVTSSIKFNLTINELTVND